MIYITSDGREVCEVMAPWKLYFANHDWYVFGGVISDDSPDQDRGCRRRVSRIKELSPYMEKDKYYYGLRSHVDRAFSRGGNEMWVNEKNYEEKGKHLYEVKARFTGAFCDSVMRTDFFPGEIKKLRINKNGKSEVDYSVLVENLFEIKHWFLSAADSITVEGPWKLKEELKKDVGTMLKNMKDQEENKYEV